MAIASKRMAVMLFKANCLLMAEKASSIKGMLIKTINIDSEKPVSSEVISEIPVTPPSRKELGSRNPLSPKLADSTPIRMRKPSRIKYLRSIFLFCNAL